MYLAGIVTLNITENVLKGEVVENVSGFDTDSPKREGPGDRPDDDETDSDDDSDSDDDEAKKKASKGTCVYARLFGR
jgi:hypothetical protein